MTSLPVLYYVVGRSGAGKTTVMQAVRAMLQEEALVATPFPHTRIYANGIMFGTEGSGIDSMAKQHKKLVQFIGAKALEYQYGLLEGEPVCRHDSLELLSQSWRVVLVDLGVPAHTCAERRRRRNRPWDRKVTDATLADIGGRISGLVATQG